MTIDSKYIIETDMTRKGGETAFNELMKQSKKPDVIVCSGDLSAHGVLIAALNRGLKVPGDLAVTGFANEEFTAHTSPSLTTVNQKGNEIGRKSAELFLNGDSSHEKRQIVVETEIIFRESSGMWKNEKMEEK